MTIAGVLSLTVAVLASASAQGAGLDTAAFPERLRAAVAQVAPVYRQRPNDPSVLYQVAALHSRAGHTEEALAALRRMADHQSGVDPRLRDGFQNLADHPEFIAIRARIQRDDPPVRRAERAVDIADVSLIPEGVAWSPRTGLLYFGGSGKVTAVDLKGQTRVFTAPEANGLGAVLGMRADERRGELWVTSSGFGRPIQGAVLGLFRFRLSDGSFVASYPIDDKKFGFLNDIAVGPDGIAYATATHSGALIRANPTTGRTDVFLPPGTLPEPNGIAASADGRYVFVAGWYGIVRVDLRTRATLVLKQSSHIASGCLDGLYLTSPLQIIGVQNCVHATGRIMRFTLSPARDSIQAAEVLESYNPLFDGITTAAVAGPVLYFVANTQFRKLGPDGKPAEPLDPIHVLRLPLQSEPCCFRLPF